LLRQRSVGASRLFIARRGVGGTTALAREKSVLFNTINWEAAIALSVTPDPCASSAESNAAFDVLSASVVVE
jgi:hypothetical protein